MRNHNHTSPAKPNLCLNEQMLSSTSKHARLRHSVREGKKDHNHTLPANPSLCLNEQMFSNTSKHARLRHSVREGKTDRKRKRKEKRKKVDSSGQMLGLRVRAPSSITPLVAPVEPGRQAATLSAACVAHSSGVKQRGVRCHGRTSLSRPHLGRSDSTGTQH